MNGVSPQQHSTRNLVLKALVKNYIYGELEAVAYCGQAATTTLDTDEKDDKRKGKDFWDVILAQPHMITFGRYKLHLAAQY